MFKVTARFKSPCLQESSIVCVSLFARLFAVCKYMYKFVLVCNMLSLCKLCNLDLFFYTVNRKLCMELSHGIFTKKRQKMELSQQGI